jgi:hypothetical protein
MEKFVKKEKIGTTVWNKCMYFQANERGLGIVRKGFKTIVIPNSVGMDPGFYFVDYLDEYDNHMKAHIINRKEIEEVEPEIAIKFIIDTMVVSGYDGMMSRGRMYSGYSFGSMFTQVFKGYGKEHPGQDGRFFIFGYPDLFDNSDDSLNIVFSVNGVLTLWKMEAYVMDLDLEYDKSFIITALKYIYSKCNPDFAVNDFIVMREFYRNETDVKSYGVRIHMAHNLFIIDGVTDYNTTYHNIGHMRRDTPSRIEIYLRTIDPETSVSYIREFTFIYDLWDEGEHRPVDIYSDVFPDLTDQTPGFYARNLIRVPDSLTYYTEIRNSLQHSRYREAFAIAGKHTQEGIRSGAIKILCWGRNDTEDSTFLFVLNAPDVARAYPIDTENMSVNFFDAMLAEVRELNDIVINDFRKKYPPEKLMPLPWELTDDRNPRLQTERRRNRYVVQS